jgi:hypothetical protein
MKTKYFFLAAFAATFASCANEEYIGDNSPNATLEQTGDGSIQFGSGFKAVTRANHVGADAANLLNGKFIVGGFKGSYTTGQDLQNVTVATGKVFDNYIVRWGANTAGTTESNTSDWEYAGINAEAPSGIAGNDQSIKYWDYSASQYDFIAYSTGTATITATGTAAAAIAANKVLVSAITPTTAKTSAYTLAGNAADLAKCYIADMVTVYKDGTDGMHYQDEVQLTFRSLASKVRMAIYETVPGYSVKNVYFYTDASTTIAAGPSANVDATLFTTGATAKDNFYTAGTYTVKFPTIGKDNVTPTKESDYNKAHASFAVEGSGKATTKAFGQLQKVGRDYKEAAVTEYIGRTATTASFAGTTAPYYQIAMPNEEGTVLELRVDYTLVSIDGSGEEITVHGATAFVPAIYAQWKSNYAYTYIFKISDNSNGWTSTVTDDPAGLYPITFDAIVVDSEEHVQSTITNVATPSITTYQKGHVYNDGDPTDEYDKDKGKIYVQVYWDGASPALRADLDTKGQLYTLSAPNATEADVISALNSQVTPVSPYEVSGRNGLNMNEETSNAAITAVPGADGNDITVAAGTAAEFTPAAGTYAYVYDTEIYAGDYYPVKPADWDAKYNTDYYTSPACTSHPSSVFSAGTYYKKTSEIASYNEFTAAPVDWQNDASNPYYSNDACTTQITGTFASHHTFALTSEPADWGDGVYYTDDACTTPATGAYADNTYYKKVKCYRKYVVNNKIYGVKVIKVVN